MRLPTGPLIVLECERPAHAKTITPTDAIRNEGLTSARDVASAQKSGHCRTASLSDPLDSGP
jgi:hypothetical protein